LPGEPPFFRHWRTYAVLAGIALLAAVNAWLPLHAAAAEGLDPDKVRVGLAIFLCIAFLWMSEALPLSLTALLVPLLAVLMGVGDLKSSLAPFADPLIFLFFGGFALASALTFHGLDRWLAQSLVKLGRGSFMPVAICFFAGTAFLSMWMSNTATAAMMLPLAIGILNQTEAHSRRGSTVPFLLLGLAYSASIGGLGTVIGSPPNGIAAAQLGLSFAEWLVFGVPAVLVLLPAMIGVLYLVFRPQPGLRIHAGNQVFRFTAGRKVALAIFAAAALCWSFGGQLGPMLGISAGFDTVVALGVVAALLFFRVVGWRQIDRGTDWGVLLLFGGGLALSGILRETGASLFLARLLTESVGGWPVMLLVGAVVMFVIFLTELSSNTATAALFVPIFHSVALELGVAPGLIVVPLALAASCAFMMPVATPPNALVFGSGRITQREMMAAGLVLNLVFVALLTAFAVIF
jgi:solute carrier family 13 (sodium-dependent dicarboxylate transporter), member 2/3/5